RRRAPRVRRERGPRHSDASQGAAVAAAAVLLALPQAAARAIRSLSVLRGGAITTTLTTVNAELAEIAEKTFALVFSRFCVDRRALMFTKCRVAVCSSATRQKPLLR